MHSTPPARPEHPALHCPAAGLPQWCSVTPHVDPLLCGVTAVGEYLLWDVCREGLPVLQLIRTKDPRLKQIRLFWKERGSCSTDMPYHQMAPMLTSALEKCQLNKTKVGNLCCLCDGACMMQGVCATCTQHGTGCLRQHPVHACCSGPAKAPCCELTQSPCCCHHPPQCMHLCRDTSPVLLATSGASLSLIELHCRSVAVALACL
jgi:hypothetical protein